MATKKKPAQKFSEGDVFLVRLCGGSGFARVVLGRWTRKNGALGWFFGPRLPSAKAFSLDGLEPSRAVHCHQFGDLHLLDAPWPIVGRIEAWHRAGWPVPTFFRGDEPSCRFRVDRDDDLGLIGETQLPKGNRIPKSWENDSLHAGRWVMAGECANFNAALTLARTWAGCDKPASDCSENTCGGRAVSCGCDLCPMLQPYTWPYATFDPDERPERDYGDGCAYTDGSGLNMEDGVFVLKHDYTRRRGRALGGDYHPRINARVRRQGEAARACRRHDEPLLWLGHGMGVYADGV